MRLQGAFDLSRCTPHERHDRTFVARRTHRNGEPPFGTHGHKNHPNLRQNHRPEDKPRHGNPVAQVGGYGEEYLPSHLIKNRIPMKEERNIITMDGQGNIFLPSDIGATAMTEWEICELFGVIAPTVRAGIKALCKSEVLNIYDIKRIIRISDRYSAEVYNLRNDSRPCFPYRIVRGGESPQGIIGKDYTRAKRENDGIRVGCFGRQAQQPLESMMIYQHTNMQIYHYGDIYCRFYSSFQRKAEQSFPFTKAKQARGFMSAKRSGGCAVSR